MNSLRSVLFAICFMLFAALSAQAQQPPDEVGRLKDEIQRLAAVDRDQTSPTDVREFNRKFLRERRLRLRVLLQNNLEGLKKYLSTIGSSLTSEERRIIQEAIQELENEISGLDRELQEGASTTASTAEPSNRGPSPAETSTSVSTINQTAAAPANTPERDSSTPPRNLRVETFRPPQPADSTSLNATVNARIRAKVRIDQTDNTNQTETPSISTNSTSLVDQSSASDLIGVATNLAGLSAISNNSEPEASSVSVTASAYALLAALNRVDPLNPIFYDQHRAWRNFSITLGYDDEDQLNGTKQRAELFGAKYMFINRRDPGLKRNSSYVDTVTASLERAASAFGRLSTRIRGYVFTLESVRNDLLAPGFKNFLEKKKPEVELALERERNRLIGTSGPERASILERIATLEDRLARINGMIQNPADPKLFVLGTNALPTSDWSREELEYQTIFLNEFLGQNYREKLGKENADAVDRFIDQQLSAAELVAFKNLDENTRSAVESIRRAPQLSVSFLSKQRKVGFDEYMGQLIFDYGVANRINLSLNGSYNYKDSKVIGGDTRGFSFAGQLQFQLNRENLLGKKPFFLDVSTQGKWMSGTTAVYKAQGKFTLPIADGIDFPISVTYANRSDLINEQTVKAQFGFTVDTARLIRAFIFR